MTTGDPQNPHESGPAWQVEPHGQLMTARIGDDGFPIVQFLTYGAELRTNARAIALKHMRERCEICVIFVRSDGMHESWNRGELENEARPPELLQMRMNKALSCDYRSPPQNVVKSPGDNA